MLRYIIILLFAGTTTILSAQPPNIQRLTDSLFQNWQDKSNTIENRRDNFNDYIWKAHLFVNPDSIMLPKNWTVN